MLPCALKLRDEIRGRDWAGRRARRWTIRVSDRPLGRSRGLPPLEPILLSRPFLALELVQIKGSWTLRSNMSRCGFGSSCKNFSGSKIRPPVKEAITSAGFACLAPSSAYTAIVDLGFPFLSRRHSRTIFTSSLVSMNSALASSSLSCIGCGVRRMPRASNNSVMPSMKLDLPAAFLPCTITEPPSVEISTVPRIPL